MGTTVQNKSYHYHANINCTSAGSATGANNASTCKQIGYYTVSLPFHDLKGESTKGVIYNLAVFVIHQTEEMLEKHFWSIFGGIKNGASAARLNIRA
jgi:hypothetical protein